MFLKEFDVEYLRSRFSYDEKLGKLFWKAVPADFSNNSASWNSKNAGKEAGYLHQGYRYVRLSGTNMLAHRICFAIYTGRFPEGVVDHLDGDKLNNKIDNLSDCTPQINSRNAKLNRLNKSGICGVGWDSRDGAWYAQIGSGESRLKRWFRSLLDACCWRKSMELKLGYSENHGKRRDWCE